MAHGGKREGAGRKKGIPNKITAEYRLLTRALFERRFGEMDELIGMVRDGDKTRAADPKGAAELTLRLAEFFIPKLRRLNIDLTQIPIEEIVAELERREALWAAENGEAAE